MNDPKQFADLIGRARRQVENVTRNDEAPSGPSQVLGTSSSARSNLPGYELIRELARGGQGVVYLARQQGTKRLVAIKMVRDGPFSSTAERVRFEREIEVLGSLRHSNIVTIHDSGEAAGCSYFVMDFIDGPTLDAFIRERRHHENEGALPLESFVRETLALFVDVTTAVHAAHLRGIIHRDLKPSNIRLNHDGHPLVLDFGLAKSSSTGDHSSTAASLTETGQFVGTLNYASPEQVDGDGTALDLRTDIYALGVILYELLTGRWPYVAAETATVRQKFDAILQQEPQRLRTWNTRLDDDVETIVLKCLDKQPERRYQSAGDLTTDIRRYLAGEPIEARRDSHWYVLRKMLARHKWAATTAAVVLLVLGTSTVALLQMYGSARRETAKAKVIQAFIEDMLVAVNPDSAGGQDTTLMRMLLDDAAERIENELQDQAEVEAALRHTIARAYESMYFYAQAEGHAREASRIRRELLGAAHPEALDSAFLHLGILGHMHRFVEFEQLCRELMDVTVEGPRHYVAMAQLGSIMIFGGDLNEAENLLRTAADGLLSTVGTEDASTAEALSALGYCLFYAAKYEESEHRYRQARDIFSRTVGFEKKQTLEAMGGFSRALRLQGKLEEAQQLYEELLEIRLRLYGPHHVSTLETKLAFADILTQRGEFDEADNLYRQLVHTSEQAEPRDEFDLGGHRIRYAQFLSVINRYDEAVHQQQAAYEGLVKQFGAHDPLTQQTRATLIEYLELAGHDDRANTLRHETGQPPPSSDP